MRIALLEADVHLSQTVRQIFCNAEHHCHIFRRSDALLLKLQRDTFDLVVIAAASSQAALPALSRLKRKHSAMPMMVVSHAQTESALLTALDGAADDYIAIGSDRVLLARAQALTRLAQSAGNETALSTEFDDYSFEPAGFLVRMPSGTVTLTPKEFALALLMFRNMSRELSRDYLIETVWGRRAEVASRTLDTHASRLRSKLRLSPEHGYLLSAVYSQGYRLDRLPEDHALAIQAPPVALTLPGCSGPANKFAATAAG
ncbi:DNA-binding response regulator, OmpR family, contains REC and winged-helix (wHTH) domain [Chitinasiproducens palmae]|uniref:DNA-binding response regulator, OmpR family, contains REC and winged-helix (WHTH) domain n=1 Tax=Chitinasiproducens palmae TaxID=1770053 RepID=A0A1H2PVF3_9BURK|nr:DNA-binding response regulator, OmpR family, contains REC and winged-helix (wHTH) domain [Chitinasiproducens palmae]